jgi:hypothetical protein
LGYNYFVAAFYPEVLELIMEEAYLLDLVGPGKFWIISGTADTAPTVLSGNFVIRKGKQQQLRQQPKCSIILVILYLYDLNRTFFTHQYDTPI